MANITILDETDKTYLEGKIDSHKSRHLAGGDDAIYSTQIILLSANGWSENSQTVSVAGVTNNSVVFVSPYPTYQDAYTNAGIKCTEQSTGTLTFTCKLVPTQGIHVSVVILGVNA